MLSLHKCLLFDIFTNYFDFCSIYELSLTCKKADSLFKEYFISLRNLGALKKNPARFYIYAHIRNVLMKMNTLKAHNVYDPKYNADYLICNLFTHLHKYFRISRDDYQIIKRHRIIPFLSGYYGDDVAFKSENDLAQYNMGRIKADLPLTFCNVSLFCYAVYKGKKAIIEKNLKYRTSASMVLAYIVDLDIELITFMEEHPILVVPRNDIAMESFLIDHSIENYGKIIVMLHSGHSLFDLPVKLRHVYEAVAKSGFICVSRVFNDLYLAAMASGKSYITEHLEEMKKKNSF